MRYDAWRRIKSVQNSFQNALYKLASIFGDLAKSSSDVTDFSSKMLQFQESEEYENYILSIIKRMVTPISVGNMATWRRAAKKASKGRLLYGALMKEINEGLKDELEQIIHDNALLIKTLPSDVANKVTMDIYRMSFTGMRASDISKYIKKYTSQHARASARLIARTEVSKTTSALTQIRSQKLGIKWYVWRTAQDGNRVRSSHRIMEGVIVNWNDPPSPELLDGKPSVGKYHAGNIWNCRCYSEPLIDVDDVQWPHKVHINGKIKNMSKQEFMQLNA